MKKAFLIASILTTTFMSTAQSTSIYDYSFQDIEGNEVSLEQFHGKKILFINVASKCGYTDQYEEMQQLHDQYGDKVVLIGFPCNQFGLQEPGSEEEIVEFCQKNYGVTFLMASKIDVKGNDQHPIYSWLTSKELNGVEDGEVNWNFNKFLVDENGKYVAYFKSGVRPMSEELTEKLK
jgi:glutathione peroxidase